MTTNFMRRHLLLAGGAGFAGSLLGQSPSALASGWPARPIRVVIPGAAGGLFDTSVRQLAEHLEPMLGQPLVPDYRVGGGGLLGMQHLARSAADGYTLGVCSFTQLTVNPWMYPRPAYDPINDFSPVTALFHSPVVLATRQDSPLTSAAGVLEQARSRPGRLTYATSGVGQPPHVLFELVEHQARAHLVHVPYRGGPPAVMAVMAGDVDLVFEGSAGIVQHVRSGRLRALAVSGEQRIAALPDVPTFSEVGVAGIDNSWMGLVAPAGTPPEIIHRLQREISEVLAKPSVRAAYEASGRIAIGNSPAEFSEMIRHTIPKWRELVRVAGLKPE
jgi:tripartite-type tricarboxylate transporter receptor subunit TctC